MKNTTFARLPASALQKQSVTRPYGVFGEGGEIPFRLILLPPYPADLTQNVAVRANTGMPAWLIDMLERLEFPTIQKTVRLKSNHPPAEPGAFVHEPLKAAHRGR